MEKQPKSREEYLISALEEIPSGNLIDIAKHIVDRLPKLEPKMLGMSEDLTLVLSILERRIETYEKIFDTTKQVYENQIPIEEIKII